jgi:SAM-dependent methyltransferase
VGFHGFFISGCESMTYCPIPTEVEYWNDYAPWYQRWRTHNDYNGSIVEELKRRVRPGWRVLDIGAADGALALPLSLWGCRVTALEPARRLREDLTAGGFRKALAKIIALRPRRVLVVAEAEATGLFILNQPGYSLRDFQAYETDSHFAYHAPSEAVDHWQACYGVRPSPEERRRLFQRLCFEDGHWWLKERVTVRMFYWKKVEMF